MKTWFFANRVGLVQAFFAALVIPWTWELTALGIYFTNMVEIPGNPGTVLTSTLILASLAVLLLFIVQLPFLGRKVSPWIVTTMFTLGFLLWFQANVFNWDLGVLDGREIDWKKYRLLGIFELVVYGVIFFLAYRFKNKLLEHLVPIACTLIFIQAVPVSLAAAKLLMPETTIDQVGQTAEQSEHDIFTPSWKQYAATFDVFFEFSREENVVLLILDTFGQKVFEDIQREFPKEIEEIFHDFSYFTHTVTERTMTPYCIPQILTGCFTEDIPQCIDTKYHYFQHKVFNRNGALLKTLSENQYRCDVFSYAPATMYYDSRWIANIRLNSRDDYWEIIPGGYAVSNAGIPELTSLTLLRSAPIFLKNSALGKNFCKNLYVIIRYFTVRARDVNSSYRSLGDRKARIEDSEFNDLVLAASRNSFSDSKTLKFVHLRGAHIPYTMNENCKPAKLSGDDSLNRQARGSLRIVQNILELMKESDVYHQSLIIVMADHGSGGLDRKHPFFLIKRKHSQQSQMAYNDNPIHIRDTTPIILSELGILQGEDAFSPFEMPETLVNERKSQWESIWNK